jgi:hypothetical protein
MSSSSPSELVAPSSVTIPANSNSVTFALLAPQSMIIAPAKNYTVGASSSGYAGTIANLTVLNNNAPMLALSLDPTNISEAGGPFAAVGTVSRAPVSDQAVTIALASTNTGAAVVPAQVTIPGLQAAASFYVSAIHDTNVTGPKVTLISAQGLDNVGNPVGTAATQILTVQDIDGSSLQVLIANKVVPKGTTAATTAAVWTTLPPTNDLVVALSSSDTKEATVPATVTIPRWAKPMPPSVSPAWMMAFLPATIRQPSPPAPPITRAAVMCSPSRTSVYRTWSSRASPRPEPPSPPNRSRLAFVC